MELINNVEDNQMPASMSPLAAVADKLAAARGAAASALPAGQLGPRLVMDDEIVFDSGRAAGEQVEGFEGDQWDQRLAQREREKEGQGGGWGRW